LAGYIPRWFTRPQTVTHPSTNRVWCSATTLIEANALPLSQTANLAYTPILVTIILPISLHYWKRQQMRLHIKGECRPRRQHSVKQFKTSCLSTGNTRQNLFLFFLEYTVTALNCLLNTTKGKSFKISYRDKPYRLTTLSLYGLSRCEIN